MSDLVGAAIVGGYAAFAILAARAVLAGRRGRSPGRRYAAARSRNVLR